MNAKREGQVYCSACDNWRDQSHYLEAEGLCLYCATLTDAPETDDFPEPALPGPFKANVSSEEPLLLSEVDPDRKPVYHLHIHGLSWDDLQCLRELGIIEL